MNNNIRITGGLLTIILFQSCNKQADNVIKDIDGNVYTSVTIGTQVWMVENLKTTRYNDGTPIPLVTDTLEWSNLTTAGYCWYENDEVQYKDTYGALYNYFVFSLSNNKNICPTGWHVPSDTEWHTLALNLDASALLGTPESYTAGGKLKEMGLKHWESPNTGGTNETGFTALPGGVRYSTGEFGLVGLVGSWWSNTAGDACTRDLGAGLNDLLRNFVIVTCGCSSRCIKDN
jgi:uncharacterized protein (TIGR02145 family)